MKTVTITLHDTENCGSSLQAFALQHYLKECGIDNEIINYIPAYTQNSGHLIRTFIRRIFYLRTSLLRRIKFHAFIRKHLVLTKQKYRTLTQLKRHPPIADCYITGSDQLWNTMYACGRDPAFYLDFAEGKKIAYAVSLGRERIPEDNREMVKRYISDFSAISVREASSVKQIGDLWGKKVAHVCDPVLLNPISAYDGIRGKRMIQGPYVLVYIAQGIERSVLDKWIENVNETKKRAIVYIGSNRAKCRCDHHISIYSPGEFLSLIYFADYVISNSFHATLFSLMYQKQFATILPKENGARICSLLSDVGLPDHALTQNNNLPDEISVITYEKIQSVLDTFRKESQKWLRSAISNGSD